MYRHFVAHTIMEQLKGEKPMLADVRIDFLFYFPEKRRRDRDNLIAMFKSGIDGMVDAGLIIDDHLAVPMPPVIRVVKDCKRNVVVSVRACEPEFWVIP
jgi:Holliday junction resolvase RusA-like endonuclease